MATADEVDLFWVSTRTLEEESGSVCWFPEVPAPSTVSAFRLDRGQRVRTAVDRLLDERVDGVSDWNGDYATLPELDSALVQRDLGSLEVEAIGEPGDACVVISNLLGTAESEENEGPSVIALLSPPGHAVVVPLEPGDYRSLFALSGDHFARVVDIFRLGLALQEADRATVAFVEVCVEYPRLDNICGGTEIYAVRREHGLPWALTELCTDDGQPCWWRESQPL